MTAVRISFPRPRPETAHWLSMGAASLVLHVSIFLGIVVLPRLIPSSSRFPTVYEVEMVSLPAGLPGPPAQGSGAAAPPPKPAPRKEAPPIKIPEEPKKSSEKKPPKKEPPKPKPPPPKEPDPEPEPVSSTIEPPIEPTPEGPQPEESGGEESSGMSAGGGTGFGTGGGGGSGLLDDASFEYGWYLTRMVSILRNNWARPLATSSLRRQLRAVVYFRIRRDGTLTSIELEESSGDSMLDVSALRAVRDSNPLPPLPYQYGRDSLGVHFFFELEPD